MKHVLVTGGASFIGSHIVEGLLDRGIKVRVVDNLSSGKLSNLRKTQEKIDLWLGDINDEELLFYLLSDIDTVIHLAAEHGGRGYVDLHQVACSRNLAMDGKLFMACAKAGVEKVVYASSGCVYPNWLQGDPTKILYLTENMVGPPYDADNMYGWAKLMAEMTLKAYYQEGIMKSANCRYFTVYGPRGKEDHAVIAMIARAFINQNPFVVWGDGTQIRNWTYVTDIAEGTIRVAEKIEDGTAINLGTMERTSVLEAVDYIKGLLSCDSPLEFQIDMPTGPLNRVADNALAKQLLDWEPKVSFKDGVAKTIDWYKTTKSIADVTARLEGDLTER